MKDRRWLECDKAIKRGSRAAGWCWAARFKCFRSRPTPGYHHHHHHPIIIIILNNIPHHHHGLHLKTTLLSPAVIMHGWVHLQSQWLRFVFFLYSQHDRTGQDYVVVCVDMKHSIQCWNILTRSQFYFIVYLYIFGEHVWYFVHFRYYPRYDVVFCVDATSALFPLDYPHHLLFL